ncbi:uncharacterized protein NEMAJ01_1731 [Nematocida major]|uniref:uncharacterized protein n=1 Tax=Nematocida major TaxID=1912982 RepID=UPI002008129B|nr:uncharacterized protein NEMAJ01_1731 [Nematocida major]KAH9386835.1 hypothetical protein NEMAJ01_1731 [Nematocida major]
MSTHSVLLRVLEAFRKGRKARVVEIAESLQITKKECVDSLYLLESQLEEIGYSLRPGTSSRVDREGKSLPSESTGIEYTHLAESFKKCDFVFLVKKFECSEDANRFVNENVAVIVYAYMVLYLNGSETEYSRVEEALRQIGKCPEILKEIVGRKYFYKRKRNDGHFLRPGWRFFLEFPEFSPQEYLAALRASAAPQ